MKFLLSPILLIGLLCLSNFSIVTSAEEEYYDDYFYDEGEAVPDIKYQKAPPTTTTTTTTTTTQKTTTLPTTTTTITTTESTTEFAEPIKPIEDNFGQVLNEKKIEIIKKPYDEINSDVVYDDSEDYNEDTYDEGEYEVKNDFKDENIVTKLVTIRPEDYQNYEEDDSSEETHNEVQDGAKHNLANAANVHARDNVRSEQFKFNLNMVYVIVPVASLCLVVLVVVTVLVLAKKTNVFNRKSQGGAQGGSTSEPTRKQIYKSVAQQDPIV